MLSFPVVLNTCFLVALGFCFALSQAKMHLERQMLGKGESCSIETQNVEALPAHFSFKLALAPTSFTLFLEVISSEMDRLIRVSGESLKTQNFPFFNGKVS